MFKTIITWALAISLIFALSFIGGVLDGTIELHSKRMAK